MEAEGAWHAHNSNEIEHAADANGQGAVDLWSCGWAAPFLNNIMLRSALGREN